MVFDAHKWTRKRLHMNAYNRWKEAVRGQVFIFALYEDNNESSSVLDSEE